MREVEFLKYNEENPTLPSLYHKGKFHQWGNDLIEDSDGNIFPITVGIIEGEDGQIHKVNPSYIQFIS